jgi:MraZ protein
MFRGEHEYQLDDRFRTSLPKDWRAELRHGGFLTRGWDSAIFLFPWETWLEIEKKIAEIRVTDLRGDVIRRFLMGGDECWLDAQGRVTISAPLRTYANLQKDLIVRGVGRFIEIWSRERWLAYQAQTFEPGAVGKLVSDLNLDI